MLGLIDEENGGAEPPKSRKIGDTVQRAIARALECRSIIPDESVVQSFRKIAHRLDIWHKAKKLHERILAAGKVPQCRNLLRWTSAITNHFWFSCETCSGSSYVLKVGHHLVLKSNISKMNLVRYYCKSILKICIIYKGNMAWFAGTRNWSALVARWELSARVHG
jgi:hypothetical protein